MTTRVIHSPGAPFGYFSCLIGLLGGGAALASGDWPVALVFLLFSFAIGIRGIREAVVVGDEGLVIRNPLRTYRLRWSEVQDVQTADRGGSLLRELSPNPVGSVITKRGHRIRLGVTRTIYQRSWTANDKTEEIRRAWQVARPASIVPMPDASGSRLGQHPDDGRLGVPSRSERGANLSALPRLTKGWLVGCLAALVLLASVSTVLARHLRDGYYGGSLSRYLSALVAGESDRAYDMLCAKSMASMSEDEFQRRLQADLASLGPIRDIYPLRGGDTVGVTVLNGTLQTVKVDTPMRKEGGAWKPCPVDDPFGEIRPTSE